MGFQDLKRLLQLVLIALIIGAGLLPAQDLDRTIEFQFGGRAIVVPRFGPRFEVLPVLELMGAEAGYSPAAGTFIVVWGERSIQFAIDHKMVLIDGTLQEARDAPAASPGGVAVSLAFLDRSLLSPMDHHLEPIPGGYRIVPGARFADPVTVRPAAADFGATTTLLLSLSRPAEVLVEETPAGAVVVRFEDASPQLDSTVPFRSRRVHSLTSRNQTVELALASGVGLLSWHVVEDPPRVIVELGIASPTPTPAPVQVVRRTGPRPIVIDPGHGGDDVGARSADGLMEKDLVLGIAHRLKRVLEARGHPVRLTREDDVHRALTDRTALANRLEARVFISLHANASTVASVSGAETYYMSLDQSSTDAEAAATADLENRAGAASGERSPLDLILWDLAQAEVLNESADLALALQGRLNALLGLRDRGVKQAPFVVLTGATMPAALVEVGFLSNPSQASLLAQPTRQQELAEAIADGVEDFVRR